MSALPTCLKGLEVRAPHSPFILALEGNMDDSSTSSAEATGTSASSDSSAGSSSNKQRPSALSTTAPPLSLAPPAPPQSISLEKSYVDLDAWLEKLTQGTPLTEPEVKSLTELARERFLQESNVQPVPAPVTICGDIHVRGTPTVLTKALEFPQLHVDAYRRDNGTI